MDTEEEDMISEQDRRILACLRLKHAEKAAAEARAHRQHRQWLRAEEADRRRRAELADETVRLLARKRSAEAEENEARLAAAREGFLRSQERLRELMRDKEERHKCQLEKTRR